VDTHLAKWKDIMSAASTIKRGKHMNTTRKLHSYRSTKMGTQLNHKHTVFPNPLFNAILNPVFPMLLNGTLGFHYKFSTTKFSLLAFTNTVVI
jgi:hypothetical protein